MKIIEDPNMVDRTRRDLPGLVQASRKAFSAAWNSTEDQLAQADAAETAVETVWFAYWTLHAVSAHSGLPGAYYA